MTDQRFCPACGASAPRGRFCPSCGTSLPDLSAMGAAPAQEETEEPVAASRTPDAPNALEAATGDGEQAAADEAIATLAPPTPHMRSTPPAPTPQPAARAASGPSAAPGTAAPPTPAAPARHWLPFALIGGVIIAVGAIATVVLLLVGGDPDSTNPAKPKAQVGVTAVALSTQNVYAQTQRQKYYALLPAGWINGRPPAQLKLEDDVSVISAQDPKIQVTVGQATGGGSLQTVITAAAGKGALPSSVILLPAKRTARRSEAVADGTTTITYALSSCGRIYVVAGSAPTAKLEQVKSRFGVVASTIQAQC